MFQYIKKIFSFLSKEKTRVVFSKNHIQNDDVLLKLIDFKIFNPNFTGDDTEEMKNFVFLGLLFDDYEINKHFGLAVDNFNSWRTWSLGENSMIWVIYSKRDNFKKCGFITFALNTGYDIVVPNNFEGCITCAIKPEYRKKNIAFTSMSLVLNALKASGVRTIEARIDEDNTAAINLIPKLNFSEIIPFSPITSVRSNQIKTKVYQHYLYNYSDFNFYVIPDIELYRGSTHSFLNNATLYSMFDVPIDGHLLKCSVGFERNIFAAYVGKNNVLYPNKISLIFWKLYSEIKIGNKIFLVFEGIDEKIGYQNPISGHMIAIDKALFAAVFKQTVDINPNIFTKKDLANLILDIDIFDTKNISKHPDLERKNLELLKN